ncbi:hypothetical protein ACH474_24545 [Nocardia rhamnosiphila]
MTTRVVTPRAGKAGDVSVRPAVAAEQLTHLVALAATPSHERAAG